MADDLDLTLRSIEGEGPSPDFVATLRERVLAEAAMPTAPADDHVMVDVEPPQPEQEERPMITTRWMLAGAAAAVIALIVGLVAVTAGDDDTIRTEDPTTTLPSTVVPSTVVPTTTTPSTTAPPTAAPENVGPFGADTEELPTGFTGLKATTYWTDTFGMPFSFEIGQSLFLQENRSTSIALSSPASNDPGDKDMVFRPLSSLWNPGQVGADESDRSGTGLVGHLESLQGRIVLSNRADVVVGGRDAIRFDIEVDTSSCGADTEPCTDLARFETGLVDVVEVGWTQRIWVIGTGDDPLTVVASIWTDRDEVWLDVIEGYVATMTFADDANS